MAGGRGAEAEQAQAANSNGCIHSGDAGLRALVESALLGTPVLIRC